MPNVPLHPLRQSPTDPDWPARKPVTVCDVRGNPFIALRRVPAYKPPDLFEPMLIISS